MLGGDFGHFHRADFLLRLFGPAPLEPGFHIGLHLLGEHAHLVERFHNLCILPTAQLIRAAGQLVQHEPRMCDGEMDKIFP